MTQRTPRVAICTSVELDWPTRFVEFHTQDSKVASQLLYRLITMGNMGDISPARSLFDDLGITSIILEFYHLLLVSNNLGASA